MLEILNKAAAVAGSQAQHTQEASATSDSSKNTNTAAATQRGTSLLWKHSRNRAKQCSSSQAKRNRGKRRAEESDEEEDEEAEEEKAWDVEAIEDVRITDNAKRGTSGNVPDLALLTYQKGLLESTFRYAAQFWAFLL